jgi:hypothetical protein
MDEYCSHFTDAEENKLIYTDIHNEFREIVDVLLDNLCLELGITPELFVQVYKRGLEHPEHK